MIKTERDIAQNLGIKEEAKSQPYNDCVQKKEQASSEEIAYDKQKMIDQYITLKTENQKTAFNLKQKHDECLKLKSDNDMLKREAVIAADKIIDLESDIANLKTEFAKKNLEYDQKVSDLRTQNQIMSARVKQFQAGISQNDLNDSDKNEPDTIYEVEKLLHHKMEGNERYFLVRWKGFSSKDDTWERESNLMCPTILKKYLQAIQKK